MSVIKDEFFSKGYFLIKNFFSQEEVSKYLKLVESWPQLEEDCKFQYALPDGVSKLEQFWPLIFSEKVVSTMKEILGPETKYLQHSDIHYDATTPGKFDGDYRTVGYHRDTRFRGHNLWVKEYKGRSKAFISDHEGRFLGKIAKRLLGVQKPIFDETQEPFSIVRIAMYLNSYEEHKCPLFIWPYSHDVRHSPKYLLEEKIFQLSNSFISKFINRNVKVIPHVRSKPYLSLPSKAEMLCPEAGDALFFGPRVLHCVGTRSGPRSNLFWSYGLENSHSFDYMQYLINERKDLGYRKLDKKLIEKLKEHNLYLRGWEEFDKGPLTGRFGPA